MLTSWIELDSGFLVRMYQKQVSGLILISSPKAVLWNLTIIATSSARCQYRTLTTMLRYSTHDTRRWMVKIQLVRTEFLRAPFQTQVQAQESHVDVSLHQSFLHFRYCAIECRSPAISINWTHRLSTKFESRGNALANGLMGTLESGILQWQSIQNHVT